MPQRPLSRFVPLALAVALFAATGTVEAQSLKIGVFDPARVSQETAEGARIQARLNALQDSKRSEIESLQSEIRTLEQQFLSTATSLTEEKQKEQGLTIQRKRNELEVMQRTATQELQLEVEQAQAKWQRRVLSEVQALGSEQGFTLVLQSDLVAYFADTVDVTPQLIARLDGQQGGSGGQ